MFESFIIKCGEKIGITFDPIHLCLGTYPREIHFRCVPEAYRRVVIAILFLTAGKIKGGLGGGAW